MFQNAKRIFYCVVAVCLCFVVPIAGFCPHVLAIENTVLGSDGSSTTITGLTIGFSNESGDATVTGKITGNGAKNVTAVVLPSRFKINNQIQKLTFETTGDLVRQIGIDNIKNNVSYINQTESDADGNFTFNVTLDMEKAFKQSGDYNVFIGGTGMNAPVKGSFYVVGEADVEILVNQANQSSENDFKNMLEDPLYNKIAVSMGIELNGYNLLSESGQNQVIRLLISGRGNMRYDADSLKKVFRQAVAVVEINEITVDDEQENGMDVVYQNVYGVLNTYSKDFGINLDAGSVYSPYLSETNKNTRNGILESVWEGKPYDNVLLSENVQGIKQKFEEAAIPIVINDAQWGKMEFILSQISDSLGVELDGDFSKLSNSEKTEVYKALTGKNFSNVGEIRSAFDNEVAEQIAAHNETNSGSGNGNGGSDKASSVITVSPLPVPGSQSNVQQPVVPPKKSAVAFNDLAEFSWAKESIEDLASRGIIVGMENGEFKPGENVTREQYLKMLLAGFGLVDDSAVCSFNDVEKGTWYYPYIATAQKIGIAQGMGDGTFGLDKEISRQEMAVLACRTAQYIGLQLEAVQQAENFEDAEDIAQYAQESILTMQRAGIINGVETSRFAPTENATRAQAAKIIYSLIKRIKSE